MENEELVELFKEKVNQFDELMCHFPGKVGDLENAIEEMKNQVSKFEDLVYNNEYTLKKIREENDRAEKIAKDNESIAERMENAADRMERALDRSRNF